MASGSRRKVETVVPSCIFTTPEIGVVGLTEEQAKAAGREVRTGLFSFAALGKAMAAGTTDGFVKRANLDGSGLTTLASGLGFLNGIDVTDDTIYVSALNGVTTLPSGTQTLGAGRIFSMGLDGSGAAEILRAQEIYDPNQPFSPSQVRGVAVLAVPEPSAYAMLLAGLGLTGLAARRRRRD